MGHWNDWSQRTSSNNAFVKPMNHKKDALHANT